MSAASLLVRHVARRIMPKQVWTRLRMFRLSRSVKNFPARDVEHEYGGNKLTIHIADDLAQGWYDHDWTELEEIKLLKQHQLRPGATVFDLGAHQGVVALMLSNVVGSTGKVVAVEANEHNASVARINRRLNRAEQLVIEHAAAADVDGELVFNRGLNGRVDDGTGAWGQTRVAALTVDTLAKRHGRPAVLFIDVEGYELQVLRGAKDTLAHRPDCFIEMHVGRGLEIFGGSVDEIVELLRPTHELFMSNEEKPTPIALDMASEMVKARFFLSAMAVPRA